MTAHWASLCTMAMMTHLQSLRGICKVLSPFRKFFRRGPYFRSKIPKLLGEFGTPPRIFFLFEFFIFGIMKVRKSEKDVIKLVS